MERVLPQRAKASNQELELSISERMGIEERRRVANAINHMGQQDQEATARALGAAVERERCSKICDQFPANLMARHIGRLIRSGQ
jgi:hypothetical protein